MAARSRSDEGVLPACSPAPGTTEPAEQSAAGPVSANIASRFFTLARHAACTACLRSRRQLLAAFDRVEWLRSPRQTEPSRAAPHGTASVRLKHTVAVH